jgi:hypothetical protein
MAPSLQHQHLTGLQVYCSFKWIAKAFTDSDRDSDSDDSTITSPRNRLAPRSSHHLLMVSAKRRLRDYAIRCLHVPVYAAPLHIHAVASLDAFQIRRIFLAWSQSTHNSMHLKRRSRHMIRAKYLNIWLQAFEKMRRYAGAFYAGKAIVLQRCWRGYCARRSRQSLMLYLDWFQGAIAKSIAQYRTHLRMLAWKHWIRMLLAARRSHKRQIALVQVSRAFVKLKHHRQMRRKHLSRIDKAHSFSSRYRKFSVLRRLVRMSWHSKREDVALKVMEYRRCCIAFRILRSKSSIRSHGGAMLDKATLRFQRRSSYRRSHTAISSAQHSPSRSSEKGHIHASSDRTFVMRGAIRRWRARCQGRTLSRKLSNQRYRRTMMKRMRNFFVNLRSFYLSRLRRRKLMNHFQGMKERRNRRRFFRKWCRQVASASVKCRREILLSAIIRQRSRSSKSKQLCSEAIGLWLRYCVFKLSSRQPSDGGATSGGALGLRLMKKSKLFARACKSQSIMISYRMKSALRRIHSLVVQLKRLHGIFGQCHRQIRRQRLRSHLRQWQKLYHLHSSLRRIRKHFHMLPILQRWNAFFIHHRKAKMMIQRFRVRLMMKTCSAILHAWREAIIRAREDAARHSSVKLILRKSSLRQSWDHWLFAYSRSWEMRKVQSVLLLTTRNRKRRAIHLWRLALKKQLASARLVLQSVFDRWQQFVSYR